LIRLIRPDLREEGAKFYWSQISEPRLITPTKKTDRSLRKSFGTCGCHLFLYRPKSFRGIKTVLLSNLYGLARRPSEDIELYDFRREDLSSGLEVPGSKRSALSIE
jgi:hypothetical protein